MVLGMTTPSTFKGTWSLWKGGPEYLSISEITWEIQFTQHIKHQCFAFQMFSYACKVIISAFVATYAVNLFGKSFLKDFEIPHSGRSGTTEFDPFTGKYDQLKLDNYPINLYRTFPICLGKENSIWDGCSTAEILVWWELCLCRNNPLLCVVLWDLSSVLDKESVNSKVLAQ